MSGLSGAKFTTASATVAATSVTAARSAFPSRSGSVQCPYPTTATASTEAAARATIPVRRAGPSSSVPTVTESRRAR
ncbi:Uncharacterised protein [Mycobacteroides abscessus subsp. abscessus]|nr:Uncharacterised protein [Mycobacteroides abscessus subsp. abscessus]